MTPSRRRALGWAVAILVHPLFLAGWAVSGLTGAHGPAEVGYLVEVIVAGGFAWRLRPWLIGSGPAREPERLLYTHDGFKAKVALPGYTSEALATAVLGATLSTLGWAVGMGALGALAPERLGVAGRPVGLAVTAIALFTALHFVVHLVGMGIVGLARASGAARGSERHVELVGRTVRVGDRAIALREHTSITLDPTAATLVLDDGRGPVLIEADPGVLAWLRANFEARRALAEDPGAVPESLARLRASPEGPG